MPAQPPRRCPDEDTLVLYLEGALERRRETRVRAHLNECETCRKVVADAVIDEDEAVAAEDMTDKQPVVFDTLDPVINGKYRLLTLLGEGGMGRVYRARHLALDRDVAIKLLRSDLVVDKNVIQRFEREARAAASLNGRHVVQILDIDWLPSGAPFIVMEYLEGSDLARLLVTKGPLPVADAVRYILEACVGVAAAHARGIVHRDLKPHNLFLATDEGRGGRIKVLDFGLAKTEDASSMMVSRSAASVLGSPQFMSPEQIQNGLVDHRTDLWSLGATLFMLLTGQPPFLAPNVYQLFRGIVSDPPPRLAPLRPDIPPLLEDIIAMCLRKVPAERWATIDALSNAIRNLQRTIEQPAATPVRAPPAFPTTAPLYVPLQALPIGPSHVMPSPVPGRVPLKGEMTKLVVPPPAAPRPDLPAKAPLPPTPAPRESPVTSAKQKAAPPAIRKRQPRVDEEVPTTRVDPRSTIEELEPTPRRRRRTEEEWEAATVRNAVRPGSAAESEIATPRVEEEPLPRFADSSADLEDEATKVR
jgi:serine/threonine protein kinase